MNIKSFATLCLLTTASSGVFAASLAEARAKIGEAVSDPAVLAETIKSLTPADQKSFVGEVNAAIATMPGSAESKAATYLVANRTALKNAAKGNVTDVLAETFATASLEALTVMNERFAAELFNRAADSKVTYTDEKYTEIATNTLNAIVARNAQLDDAAVRDAFALLMFVRASNGTPANLQDTLIEMLPESSRKMAKEDWLPAALAEGADKSYAPMLGSADAGQEPNVGLVVRIAGSGMLNALLADLNGAAVDSKGYATMPNTDAYLAHSSDINYGFTQGGGFDHGLDRVPFNFSRRTFASGAGSYGSGRKIGDGVVYAKAPITLYMGNGQRIWAGSVNESDKTIVVVTPAGERQVVDPGETIEKGGTLIAEGGGAQIKVPIGTPIAPGGTPVGPGGKPIGPGGRYIEPGGRYIEPGGYQYQY